MNRLRIAILCASIGWIAADAQAQMGTYGARITACQQGSMPAISVPAVAYRGTVQLGASRRAPGRDLWRQDNIPAGRSMVAIPQPGYVRRLTLPSTRSTTALRRLQAVLVPNALQEPECLAVKPASSEFRIP